VEPGEVPRSAALKGRANGITLGIGVGTGREGEQLGVGRTVET
jgi:hypothetical protein